MRNLPQVQPGNPVIAHYYSSTTYVLAPPGTKLPEDSLTAAGVRAAPGQLPAGGAASKMVVTSLVVGVDQALHTISLVDPVGGVVRTMNVVTPQGQQSMKMVKVGDTITAIINEGVLAAVEPAS